ncbi:hypothetical protein ACP4OV_023606 [Aristida adscensionis]
MEASASAAAAAAAAAGGGNPYSPIDVSSDEEDEVVYLASSYNPKLIQIQEAIILSVDDDDGDDSRAPVSASSSAPANPSSLPSGAPAAQEPPIVRKGKHKLPSEDVPGGSKKKRLKCRRKLNGSDCAICRGKVQGSEKFVVSRCAHALCNGCVGRHVAGKIAENAAAIGCPAPGCEVGRVEIDRCRGILPPELLDRWRAALPVDVDEQDVARDGGERNVAAADDSDEEEEEVAEGEGFSCGICMETVHLRKLFPIDGCAHAFCARCVRRYIAAKVGENVLSIGCPDPGCRGGLLQPEDCRDVIPPPLFRRWGAALCDAALGALKLYCPFRDCSALLADDHGDGGAAAAASVECPHCGRAFCPRCKVPWHDGVDCAEFERLGADERGREDLLLRKIAQQRKWQRCTRCKMFVERSEGCTFMKCRCGHCFCYACGSTIHVPHHYCTKCVSSG